MTQPSLRPPPPPIPCGLLPNKTACAAADWPPDPKHHDKIWGRCEWDVNQCEDRTPPPPPPPAPAPPPAPGPPLPGFCVAHANETATGASIARVCAGLQLFDCCMRMPQHGDNCTAVVAHNGCCEFLSSVDGERSPKAGSTVVVRNQSADGKTYRADPYFGSTLRISDRDPQSSCWVNLKTMGQPCALQVLCRWRPRLLRRRRRTGRCGRSCRLRWRRGPR
jgi:hypothetical protein